MEDNKLIAEFMCLPKEDKVTYGPMPKRERSSKVVYGINSELEYMREHGEFSTKSVDVEDSDYHVTYYGFYEEELRYSLSWDWLMSVIEKIESQGFATKLWYSADKKEYQFHIFLHERNIDFVEYDDDKLQAAYKCVVEFVKWQNRGKTITKDTPQMKPLRDQIQLVVDGLNEAEKARLTAEGYTSAAFFTADGELTESYKWNTKEKMKYINIDHGTSGTFLVDKATGELFNIKGYGVADKNKKLKADIGNIFTVDPTVLFTKQHNYLNRR